MIRSILPIVIHAAGIEECRPFFSEEYMSYVERLYDRTVNPSGLQLDVSVRETYLAKLDEIRKDIGDQMITENLLEHLSEKLLDKA